MTLKVSEKSSTSSSTSETSASADKPRKFTARQSAHWGEDDRVCEIARRLRSLGLTQEDIAQVFGIGRRTLYDVRKAHPKFEEALKRGKVKLHDKFLLPHLVLAATGYDYEESCVKYDKNGKQSSKHVYTKHQPPNAQLFMCLLMNQFPKGTEMWPEGWKVRQIGGQDSRNLIVKIDAKADIEQIGRLAGKLFPRDTDRPPGKHIVSKEVGGPDSEGRGVQESLHPVVSGETTDSL